MRILTYCLFAIIAHALPAFSEIVRTTDGRSVELKEDGTYEFIEADELSSGAFVEYKDHYFVRHEGKYNINRVRFMPIFKNVSDKEIVGVKFTARFLNAFGEEIFQFSGNMNEMVSPGETSTHDLFYYFEDNQFTAGQPYDKLLPMVINKTGSIEVSFNTIAFEGGKIIELSD